MKKCTKCDISYADDKKFCKKCGSSLSQEYNIDPKELAKKTVYEEKLKADSLNTDLLLEYSQFLYNNLLFKEAVSNLLKILAINENQKQANELLFKCYLKLSMYSDARDVGKQLFENNKTDIFLLEELASIETQLGNKAKAIEYYETILKIQPANTKALYSKANIFVKNKELEKAINIFKELYKEGDRDRITIIYAGIDKCLSDNYEGAIEILAPCLSEKDISLSDLNNQRGFIYLIYSLCNTKTPINKIDEWFSWLDFDLLKNFMQSKDEEILAKSILEIINIHFAHDKQEITSGNINYFIDKYIGKSSFCFTAHTNNIFAEIWANISELQKGLGLLSDAQASLKKATELSPVTTEYANKLSDVKALFEKNKKQQKRKVLTIAATLITIIIVIIISVNLFNRHKENKEWERANLQNTYESYTSYISKYPNGKYLIQAKELKELTFLEFAVKSNDLVLLFDCLEKYPTGDNFDKAKNKIEDLILNQGKEMVLFNDNFNDQMLNSNNWHIIGDDIKQENGILKLEQNITDKKTTISTAKINFHSLTAPIKIRRRVKLHYASDYYYGSCIIKFNNNKYIKIEYLRTGYYNNNYLPLKEGVFISSSLDINREKKITNNIWDNYFEEMILFFPKNGRIEYFVNNQSRGYFDSGIILNGIQTIQLEFNPYGWWTGHYQYMDDISVSY